MTTHYSQTPASDTCLRHLSLCLLTLFALFSPFGSVWPHSHYHVCVPSLFFSSNTCCALSRLLASLSRPIVFRHLAFPHLTSLRLASRLGHLFQQYLTSSYRYLTNHWQSKPLNIGWGFFKTEGALHSCRKFSKPIRL